MTSHARSLLGNARIAAALALALALGSSPVWADPFLLNDGAVQDATTGKWTLPEQGTCPADLTKTTRPDCLALRIAAASQTACTAANGSWTTSGVCNDTETNQAACEAQPGRSWNAGTSVCSVTLKGEDRNNVECLLLGGSWVTTATCTGSWVMPARTNYEPDLLTGSGPGDACLRCHNSVTEYNGPRVRDVDATLMMGHKNMSRKVTPGKAWAGPGVCSNPLYTTEEACSAHGALWDPHGTHVYAEDTTGADFDWNDGTISIGGTDREMKWIFGNWLAPLPRAIYESPASTSRVCTNPLYSTQATCEAAGFLWVLNAGASYACARCHTTGWTSDATIQTSTFANPPGLDVYGKEPELSFAGLTWDRNSDAPPDVVNLTGGVAGDAKKYASWDQFGILCSQCHSAAVDTSRVACTMSQTTCTSLGGTYSNGVCSGITLAQCTGNGGTFQNYVSPVGMSSHHNDLTAPNVGTGYCSDPRYTAQAQCDASGAAWLTQCSVAGRCSLVGYTTSGSCKAAGGVWTVYADQTTCTANGGTWQPTPVCSVGGVCSIGGVPDPTKATQADCTAAGGSWAAATDVVRCVDIHEYGKEHGVPQFEAARWTGSKTNRGQIITSLCMSCHRQETKGLPITNGTCSIAAYTTPGECVAGGGTWTESGNGLPIQVGPYHETVDFTSHPHGNQFLNSPHGKFTGGWSDVALGNGANGKYLSAFQNEGEAANTGNGCTGCHDVHSSVVAGDEPFHEECQDCHAEIDLGAINHVGGAGTPLEEIGTEPQEACVSCHMPGGGHLFRINTSSTYSTFPLPAALNGTTSPNTAPDGSFASAAWVDVDAACGQCHGGGLGSRQTTGSIAAGSATLTVASSLGLSPNQRVKVAGAGAYVGPGTAEDFHTYIKTIAGTTVTLAGKAGTTVSGAAVVMNPTKNGAPAYTKSTLSTMAKGMHGFAGTTYPVTFGAAISGLSVTTTALVSCGGICPAFTYDWTWGDGATSLNGGPSAQHTYAAPGMYSVTLVVRLASNGLIAGSATRSLNVTNSDNPPTVSGIYSFDANAWKATVVDNSSDDHAVTSVRVDWGDGTLQSYGSQGQTFNHTYQKIGSFTITHTACDAKPQCSSRTYGPATTAYFTYSGTVFRSDGQTPVSGASVNLTKTGFSRTVSTAANGTFSMGTLKPGTYSVKVTKAGYQFANPTDTTTLGPNDAGNDLIAITP